MDTLNLNQLNKITESLNRDLCLYKQETLVNFYWSHSDEWFIEIVAKSDSYGAGERDKPKYNYIWSDSDYGNGSNSITPFYGTLDDWIDTKGGYFAPRVYMLEPEQLSNRIDLDTVALLVYIPQNEKSEFFPVRLNKIDDMIRNANCVAKEKKLRIINSIESTMVMIATTYESIADIENLSGELLKYYVDVDDIELQQFGKDYIDKFVDSIRFKNLVREKN